MKAAVIGSGFGGLALAVRLLASGVQTTVFEARDGFGGCAYAHEDQGYKFDGGPTVITDPTAIAELFTLAGRKVEDYVDIMPVSPFYRLTWPDGTSFDYVNDQDELERQIAAFEPADVEGYRRFLRYSEALLEEGYVKLAAMPFLSLQSMVKVAPKLVTLQSFRSVHGMVASFIRNEKLRQVFSFHALLVGGNPLRASSMYALIHALERRWGVHFIRGGTGALVQALVRLIREMGGEVRENAPVERITTKGDRATGVIVGGQELAFDIVASNANVVHTYGKLLGHHQRGVTEHARLVDKRFSMSLFLIYFGADRTWPDLAHHTVLFGPRYGALIEEIFSSSKLPEDFALYLHAPTVTDPSLAPPGCTSFYVLSPVPHLGNAPIDWSMEGPKYRDRILDALEERMLPGLRASLKTCSIFTPEDFRDKLNGHLGSAFSLEPLLFQSAWFRPHNRDDVIDNLYFVGAGTHPGAGLPGVIGSAKATAGLILSGEAMQAAKDAA
jgi:phytoene desaturase